MKRLALIASLALAGCDSQTYSESYKYNDVLPITTARAFLGFSETENRKELKDYLGVDPVRTEWCAAFVNAVLKENDIPGSESVSKYPLTARSFLRYGRSIQISEVEAGDIVIFPRGTAGWQGHVGFYAGTMEWKGKPYWIILGGNQEDKVSYELRLASEAIGVRRIPYLDRIEQSKSTL